MYRKSISFWLLRDVLLFQLVGFTDKRSFVEKLSINENKIEQLKKNHEKFKFSINVNNFGMTIIGTNYIGIVTFFLKLGAVDLIKITSWSLSVVYIAVSTKNNIFALVGY